MSIDKELNVKVFYLSDETVKGSLDKQFGVVVKWDIPLLEGYKYEFLKNNSWKPSINNGFWGLINFSIFKVLRNAPKGVVILHGWSCVSMILAFFAVKMYGHKIGIRGESPINREFQKSNFSRFIRKALFIPMFKFCDFFFYIGSNNKDFYKHYSVPEEKLFFTPYCVDNKRFTKEYLSGIDNRTEIRKSMGYEEEDKVILYSGKLIDKKRPLDLFQAFKYLETDCRLIFMGDGHLRGALEQQIEQINFNDKVLITGFVNQSEIWKYYLSADVFVMCSDEDETWGLSTNEAMNFALPIVLYDSVGCSKNLVTENGYMVQKGDTKALAEAINNVLENEVVRQMMGQKSQQIISEYSYLKVIEGIKMATIQE